MTASYKTVAHKAKTPHYPHIANKEKMNIKLSLTGFIRRTGIQILAIVAVICLVAAVSFFYLYFQAINQNSELKNQNSSLVTKMGELEKKIKEKEDVETELTSLQEQQKAFMTQLDICATMTSQLKIKGIIE